MSQSDWTRLSLHIAAMLFMAVAMGQIFRRMGLPALAGEILGGILLGPSLLGRVSPDLYQYLFPPSGPIHGARTAIMRTGMLSFIVTIGLGISLSEFKRVSRKAISVGVIGTFVPLFIGIAVAYVFPSALGLSPSNQLGLALFVGAILSLSANPIIARILMDLDLFDKEIGRVIMSATLVDDLVGFGVFAVVLAEFGPGAKGDGSGLWLLPMVLGYVATVLVLGKWLFPRMLRWIRANFPQPSGAVGFIMIVTLVCAAGSEALGLHSFLGAFIAGIAFAEVYEEFREPFDLIGGFSLAYVTPVFFLSMGINADFWTGFNLAMVLVVTIAAFFGKIVAVYAGGKLAGMSNREALAVGCGLNARGILGMVMAAVAFERQLIGQELYVACVLMCLLTTMAAGPALQYLIKLDPKIANAT
ncbi:MAG: cation:proton antiporter [Fimbriimonas sp.]